MRGLGIDLKLVRQETYVSRIPPPGVFVSYRREDTGPYARLLKEHLTERFPGVPIFMDLDSIEVGVDFAEAIEAAPHTRTLHPALATRKVSD